MPAPSILYELFQPTGLEMATLTRFTFDLKRSLLQFVIGISYLATLSNSAGAEPYLPLGDGVVLARVATSGDGELQTLRRRLIAEPGSAATAVTLARRYLRLNRAEGDPRYLGYAQAVLRPWWTKPRAPADIVLVRSHLRARRHLFDAALADLDRVLADRPGQPQALLSRAFILQSRGRAADALADCRKLARRVRSLATAVCLARMESLTGQSAQADRRLAQALANDQARDRAGDPAVRLWALTNHAEIARSRGDTPRAEKLFRAAMALDRRDTYLLDAYADLLLDLGRPKEVYDLFADDARADGHLLRLALASRRLDGKDARRHIKTLAARFAAARRRGDALHLREEARFELALRANPGRALTLALDNWRQQREPADARIVLEAAHAAGTPAKAAGVLDWLDRSGIEDHHLDALAAKIRRVSG